MQFIRKQYAVTPPGGGGGGGGYGDESAESFRDLNQAASQTQETLRGMTNDLRNIALIIQQDVNRAFTGTDELTKKLRESIASDLVGAIKQAKTGAEKLLQTEKNIGKALAGVGKAEGALNTLREKREAFAERILEAQREGVVFDQQSIKAIQRANQHFQTQETLLKRNLHKQEGIRDAIGMAGKFMQGLAKIPIVGNLINAQKIAQKMQETADKTGSRWRALGAGILETFKSMASALTDPSAIISGIVSLFKSLFMMAINYNKKIFETAKILGTSASEAERMRNALQSMAPLGFAAKEAAESYAQINEQLGFMGPLNNDFAITMGLIQKQTGASAQHLGAIAQQSALTGKSVNETYATMVGTAKLEGARNKLAMSTRQILDAVSKVSANIVVNFKGSTTALTAAVVRAAKLGTTLDQINKQAESLLDFETSIANQFEAEALTGMNLNLERARGLALAGDTKGVMEELNKQGMNMAKYESLNVIQRDAFAKAVGLSNEELSKQLIMQKQADALGAKEGQSLAARYGQLVKMGKTHEQIAAQIGAQEAADLRRQSMADQWNDTLEKLKDRLGAILQGPVMGIVDNVIKFVNNTKAVNAFGQKIKSVFEGVRNVLQDIPGILQRAVGISKLLVSLSIARAVATVAASAGATPVVGAGLALAAAYAMRTYLDSLTSGLGTMLSGGGGGAASVSSAAQSPATGVQPMNQAAATARTNSTAAADATRNAGPMVITPTTMIVDGAPLGTLTFRQAANVQSTEQSTGKGQELVGLTPRFGKPIKT